MEKLTARETEVLKYLIKGFTNKQIADAMFVSTHTVKAHLKHIFRKFEATNRTQVAYIAGTIDAEHKYLTKNAL